MATADLVQMPAPPERTKASLQRRFDTLTRQIYSERRISDVLNQHVDRLHRHNARLRQQLGEVDQAVRRYAALVTKYQQALRQRQANVPLTPKFWEK